MSTSDTPETDAAKFVIYDGRDPAAPVVRYDFARRLERERNELRERVDYLYKQRTELAISIDASDAEMDRLRARVAELEVLFNDVNEQRQALIVENFEREAARGEPGVWLRDQRDDYEGPETLDPMYFIGAANPGRGAHGATYSPFYAAPQTVKGEPVAWMRPEDGFTYEFTRVRPSASDRPKSWAALYTAPQTVDVDKISDEAIQRAVETITNRVNAKNGWLDHDDLRAALRAIHNNGGGK